MLYLIAVPGCLDHEIEDGGLNRSRHGQWRLRTLAPDSAQRHIHFPRALRIHGEPKWELVVESR